MFGRAPEERGRRSNGFRERKARAKTHSKDEARKKEPRASTSEP